MKRATGRQILIVVCVIGLAAHCLAFVSPTVERLADFDKRHSAVQGEAVSAEQRAAVANVRARLPDVRVEFEPVTGAPRSISAGARFLTGANGIGGTVTSASAFGPEETNRVTKAFLSEHRALFGFGPEALERARTTRNFQTPHSGLKTVVWQQEVDGIGVFEALLISHVTRNGELVSLSSQFVPDPESAANRGTTNRAALLAAPTIGARAAVAIGARNVGEELDEAALSPAGNPSESVAAEQHQGFRAAAFKGEAGAKLTWLPVSKGELRLCWDVILMTRSRHEMFRVLVDAQTGEPLLRRCLTDYLSDATYRVYTSDSPSPYSPGSSTPSSYQPPTVSRSLITLSALNTNASPNGWIDDGVNETRGNNVDAHTDRNSDNSADLPRPQGSPFRVFDFSLDLSQAPTSYTNAAVVQLFYWNNFMHDKLYELGFTEAAGNFQNTNFARGGLGNDAVQADAQDGSGVNNANFSTPPDGSPGRMQMYVFTGPAPDRDGDFDAEVVLHEYTHGLSNRRVGGGVGISALQPGGMGEGWSDFYGLSLLSEPGDDVNGVYAAGAYVTYQLSGMSQNYYFGIRRYPYCTDMNKNPLTLKDIDPTQASSHAGIPRSSIVGSTANEVHNMGEVWCVTLWEARANLINKHGWAVGNQLILQLVTDGMNLSPPNPTFLQARNAILQADLVDTGGANQGALWTAFAKRGMGLSATVPSSSTTTGVHEAFDLPDSLQILPTLLSAAGAAGGPFTPNPSFFTLTNTGAAAINWTLLNTSSWINLSPMIGSLGVGQGTNVSVTINGSATGFVPGTYNATIQFTNATSGIVQGRTFVLAVSGTNVLDDFDLAIDLSQWSAFGGVVGSTVLATNYGGSVSPPNSLWFGDDGSRFAVTIPVDTRNGGDISFSIRLANGGSFPWELVDDLPAEGVVLEGSTNSGASWLTIGTYASAIYYTWTTVELPIPASVQAPATLFRWRQLSHSGASFDHWALDNVVILTGPTPPRISTQPQSQSAATGDPVSLSVLAAGTPPLSYQWWSSGGAIAEATNSSLAFASVQSSNADTYFVIVSNNFAAITSSNAVLSVYTPVCAPPPAGLVSWWAAEGDTLDVFSTNNGVLVNGAGFASGRVGQAFSFTNGSAYVQVPASPNWAFGTSDFSIELWARFASGSGSQALIADDAGQGTQNKWLFWLNNGQLQMHLYSASIGAVYLGSGAFNPIPNHWHHLAVTRSNALFSFYVDGALNSTVTSSVAIPNANVPLTIGQAENLYYFNGSEDELSIYNRALSGAEIQAIYLAANAGKCNTPVPPTITSQPQDQTVPVGGTISLGVSAAGTQPLSYQWYRNGQPLAGATTSAFTNDQALLGDSGSYSVLVSNRVTTVLSSNAVVTVYMPACTTPPAGLISWWPAEGGALDVVGANNGALLNGAAIVSGKVGQAFSFTNGTSYVQVPASPSWAFGTSDFSIELWAQFAATNGGRALIACDAGQGTQNKWIFWLNNGQLQMHLYGSSIGAVYLGSGTFNPILNHWHHLAVTRSNSLFCFYVDGVLNSAVTSSVTIPNANVPLTIGQAENLYYFVGLEDEVSIYNRALSAADIQSIYTAGSAGKCQFENPPSILTQPQSVGTSPGGSASFSVVANGTAPLNFQWRFNATNLFGATNASLFLGGVQASNVGSYDVVVTNLFGAATSAVATLTLSGAGCTPPPSGLVSWWPAEGGAFDAIGTNNGVLVNGAGIVSGQAGRAFSFTNGSAYVQVPASPNWNLGANNFSIELWAQFFVTNGSQALVADDAGQGTQNKWIFWLNNGQLQMHLYGSSIGAVYLGSGTFNPIPNHWHHLAVTRNGTLLSFYVDGTLNSSVTSSVTIPNANVPLTIGQAENLYYFNGLEDEVSIYNRALTAGEIQTIYTAGSSGKCQTFVAPSITTHPQGQTVPVGGTINLSVSAAGTQPLGYQWYRNGLPLGGATSSKFTMNDALLSDGGSYSVLVSNAVSTVSSSNAVVTVNIPACTPLPSGIVSWWPAESGALDVMGTNNGVLVNGAGMVSGKVGQAFSFTNGTSYVQVPASPNWNLGANNFSIELWAQFAATNGSRALIADDAGQGTQNKWIFWLNNGQLQMHLYGSSIGAVYLGSGTFNPIPNHWHHLAVTRNGTLFSFYVDGALNSTATSSVTIPSANVPLTIGQAENLYYFNGLEDEVSIYNRGLSAIEIQSIYNSSVSGKCGTPPSILVPPQSKTVELGTNVTFSVSAAGLLPLTYQWLSGTNIIGGATNNQITLTNVGFAASADYSVIVTNLYGSATGGPAHLTVVDTTPPLIVTCASNRTVSVGADCAAILPDLTTEVIATDISGPVVVTQNPPPGSALALGTNIVTLTARDSSSNASVCLPRLAVVDSTPPTILAGVLNLVVNFDTNCQAILPNLTTTNYIIALDNCSPTVTIKQSPAAQTPLVPGTNMVLLTVSDNASNQVLRSVSVVVPLEPTILLQPPNVTLPVTSNAVFTAIACGASPLAYQWQHEGTNLPSGTNAVLSLANLKTNDAGSYLLMVTNNAGSATSVVATLTVTQPPVITTQPRTLAAAPGGAASFSIAVSGLRPLTYQWFRNGDLLAGQTKALLSIPSAQPEDFGNYTVGVTNTDGSALSDIAQLTIATSPTIGTPSFNLATFSLAFPTERGPVYVVEYKNSLDDTQWTTLTSVSGTGNTVQITDNGLTNASRLYRVRLR